MIKKDPRIPFPSLTPREKRWILTVAGIDHYAVNGMLGSFLVAVERKVLAFFVVKGERGGEGAGGGGWGRSIL